MSAQPTLEGLPVPPHSLRLRAAVWGIDPSSVRVAVATVAPFLPPGTVQLGWETLSLPRREALHARFGEAYTALEPWFARLAGEVPPSAVYIEEPFIPREKRKAGRIAHVFMWGVTLAALGAVLPDVRVEPLSPSEWKAAALGAGRGHADKPEILRWAQSVGYSGVLEDEADALGVATAGAMREAARG